MSFFPILYRCVLGFLLLLATIAFIWARRGGRNYLHEKKLLEKGNLDHDMLSFLQSLYAEGEIDKEEYEARKRDLAA